MNILIRILITSLAAFAAAYLLPGVHIDQYTTAIILAIVLALLNVIVKPLLILLTLPITLVTLGLFLLVINALIILIAEHFINGFQVDGFWWALFFSIVLSVITSILNGFGEVGRVGRRGV